MGECIGDAFSRLAAIEKLEAEEETEIGSCPSPCCSPSASCTMCPELDMALITRSQPVISTSLAVKPNKTKVLTKKTVKATMKSKDANGSEYEGSKLEKEIFATVSKRDLCDSLVRIFLQHLLRQGRAAA